MSRRSFLRTGSLTVAAAGLAGSVPGLSTLLSEGAPEAPGVEAGVEDTATESGPLTESVVVHLKDLQTGEMSIFAGEREVSYRDTALASRIVRAVR